MWQSTKSSQDWLANKNRYWSANENLEFWTKGNSDSKSYFDSVINVSQQKGSRHSMIHQLWVICSWMLTHSNESFLWVIFEEKNINHILFSVFASFFELWSVFGSSLTATLRVFPTMPSFWSPFLPPVGAFVGVTNV